MKSRGERARLSMANTRKSKLNTNLSLLKDIMCMAWTSAKKKGYSQAWIGFPNNMAHTLGLKIAGKCPCRMSTTHGQRLLFHGLCLFISLTCIFELAAAAKGSSFEAELRDTLRFKPDRLPIRSKDKDDEGLMFDSRVRRSVDPDSKPDSNGIGYPDPAEIRDDWQYVPGSGEDYLGYNSGEDYGENSTDTFAQMVQDLYRGPVCTLVDVRNTPRDLKDLENCTVVNGFVQIIFMPYTTESDFEKYTFPKLRMITEYLLVYRISGLRSLRKMFPNLSVIRGRKIFYSYALVLYENPQLQEIGLGNLRHIERGGARIQKNIKLCYLDTVNWKSLGMLGDKVVNKEVGKPMIKTNGLSGDEICLNQCGDEDECRLPGDDMEYCWGHKLCQQPGCPVECPNSCEKGECMCHEQCLGGCTAPNNASACRACVNVYHEGTCKEKCPPDTFLENEWRCVTREECLHMTWIPHAETCVFRCPADHLEKRDEYGYARCEYCGRTCRQDCGDEDYTIRDRQTIKRLYGCISIRGRLILELSGGDDTLRELEDALYGVEELGSLAIRTSASLVSLHFFKNLKRITGGKKALFDDTYSLYVLDNQNLRELFPSKNSSNSDEGSLRIESGKSFFHFNSKLCLKEIDKVSALTEEKEDEKDISRTTNGDRATCDMMTLELSAIEHMPMGNNAFAAVRVKWANVEIDDPRALIGYRVFYKESKFTNATRFEGLYSCGRSSASWVIKDAINPTLSRPYDDENALLRVVLHNLKPFTQYALYVRTYTISPAQKGAQSDITYFTTKPSKPSSPVDVTATALSAREILVHWNPPVAPNGHITHYIVRWQPQAEDLDLVRSVDMCKRGKAAFGPRPRPSSTEAPPPKPTTSTVKEEKGCCSCGTTKILPSHEKEAGDDVNFEDFMQREIFKTRYVESDDSDYDYNQRKRRSFGDDAAIRERRAFDLTEEENATESYNYSGEYDYFLPSESSEFGVFEPELFESATVNETNFTLTNLSHYTEYTIEVYACNVKSVGCSIYSLAASRTQRVRNFDSIPRDSFQLTGQAMEDERNQPALTWEAPSKPNGYVSSYEIDLQQKQPDETFKSNDQYQCYSINNFERNNGVYTIPTHLAAGLYRARVRAVTLAGNGDWTTFLDLEIPAGVLEREQRNGWRIFAVSALAVPVALLFALWYRKKRKEIKKAREAMMYSSTNPEYVSLAANYTPDGYEVNEDYVELVRLIGHGNFGKVFVGFARKVIKGEERTQVAIKKLHEKSATHKRFEFLMEAKLMKAFSSTHVVRLLGVVSQTADPMVIMEYMARGDLKSHLRSRREDAEDSKDRLPTPHLQERLEMAAEIADGMAYLVEMKFVHRDLAARNCLVSADGIVKIGDFGLTRDVYETDYYRKDSRGLLPIRWMAPESLRDGVFDCRSDVWSYGVVLWEIATLAEQPYQGMQPDQVTRFVIDGGYMEKPKNCPKKLYDLMLNCWEFNPDMRPKFTEVLASISNDVTERFKRESYYFEQLRAKQNQLSKAKNDRCTDEESSLLNADLFISREGSFRVTTPVSGTPPRSRSETPCGCHTQGNGNLNGCAKTGCDFLSRCDHAKRVDVSTFKPIKSQVSGSLKYSNSLNIKMPRKAPEFPPKSGSFKLRGPHNPLPRQGYTPVGTLFRPGDDVYSASTDTSGIERDMGDFSSEDSMESQGCAREPMLSNRVKREHPPTGGQNDICHTSFSMPGEQDNTEVRSDEPYAYMNGSKRHDSQTKQRGFSRQWNKRTPVEDESNYVESSAKKHFESNGVIDPSSVPPPPSVPPPSQPLLQS